MRRAVLVFLTLAACIEDRLIPCGDVTCPLDRVCTAFGCVTPADAEACAAVGEGATCTTEATPDGICREGACIAIACGNHLMDPGELCDDGNQVSGDNCSADCLSNETCGNSIVDGALGEQCDSGVPGLSGDGCTSTCDNESDLWLDVTSVVFPETRPMLVAGFGGRATLVDSRVEVWDGLSWVETPGATPLPRRTMGAIAFDRARDRIVVFGGRDEAGLVTDETWEFDGVTWVEKHPITKPPKRYQATAAFDVARGVVVMWGGIDDPLAMRSDTWEWDGTNWRDATPASSPSAHLAFAAYDEARQRVVMVVAITAGMRETWEYDGTTWTNRMPSTPPPVLNIGGGLLYDEGRARVSVISRFEDWDWDGTNWTRRIDVTPTHPLVTFSSVAYDRARAVIMYAGNGQLWQLSAAGWEQQSSLQPVAYGSMTLDERRGRLVDLCSNGTWEWDGIDWRRMTATTFAMRSIAYDAGRDETIALVAVRDDLPMETWSWNGTTWTKLAPPALPPFRFQVAMTYDRARDEIVAFSGRGVGDDAAGTWIWNGTTWRDATTAADPPTRSGGGLVYDERRHTSVLFGGQSITNSSGLRDTWEWNGTAWMPIDSTEMPPTVIDAADHMAWDPRRQVVTLVVGDSRWEFDGAWHRSPLLVRSSGQSGLHADVFGHLIALQTVDTTAKTWQLAFATERSAIERCRLATADDDGDGLVSCADPDCTGRCAGCGNGACDPVEDYAICPADCP